MQMFMTVKRRNFVQEAFQNAKVDLKRTYQTLQLIFGNLLDYIAAGFLFISINFREEKLMQVRVCF